MQGKSYNYDIREYQLRSIGLLKEIERCCHKHGINYYIIAGTLLGAVRHKGFIPWDDDMDIALMRKDYDLLMEHADEWIQEPFHIVTHENNSHYPKYFAKLEDKSTTIIENIHLGYVGGIYMDIFPLDDVPDNTVLRWIHFYKFNILRRLQYLVHRNPYKHGHGASSWIPRLVQKIFSKSWVHKIIQATLKECNGKSNCNLVMTHDDGFRAYPKSIFGTPSRCEFEGIAADAPAIPEGFLSVLYGNDYMTLPPVEKRKSHFHDYCDLNTPYNDYELLKQKQHNNG